MESRESGGRGFGKLWAAEEGFAVHTCKGKRGFIVQIFVCVARMDVELCHICVCVVVLTTYVYTKERREKKEEREKDEGEEKGYECIQFWGGASDGKQGEGRGPDVKGGAW